MQNARKAILGCVVVGLVGAMVGCATSAPVQEARSSRNEPIDYYPLWAGWGWAYDVENANGKVLALYSVAERNGDVAMVKNGDNLIEYVVLPDGVARREGAVTADFLLKSPIRKGTSWAVTDGQATIAEAGVDVSLASGAYRDCIVVEELRGNPSRVTRTTYCKGIGPVAIDMRMHSSAKMQFETIVRASLLGVTRPEGAAVAH